MRSLSWFQIWTVSWQVAVFLTPMMVGCAVLWLKAQFVTKADAVVEKNRVDGAFTTVRQDARAESIRIDAELASDRRERDARYERIKDQLGDHESRLKVAEAELVKPPTRHALNTELTKVVASVQGLERHIGGLSKQHDTTQEYLRMLIERGMSAE